jgi:CheY-like chemotaxis protein
MAGSQYQALNARSIAQAKQALEHFTPAAVLLDIMLVGEEGWRFLMELKRNDATQAIPVIVSSTMQEETKAVNLGADDYLSKPIDAPMIVRALDRATGRHSVTRVLVVDDDEVSRYLVRQLLPRGTFDLSEAATGQDALDRAAHTPPDVVLVDINMPTMSGFEFIERWSSAHDADPIPAIVLTSMSLSKAQRQRLAGASRVLSKSDLSAETLMATIESVIANESTRRQ